MVNTSIVLLSAALASGASAFTTNTRVSNNIHSSSSTAIQATSSRRDFFTTSTIATTTLLTFNQPAFAGTPPTDEELARIRTGYDNIQYLLNNWEKETTVCRENGGECKRDANAVRAYLGLRSTTDPLFQIEKVFAKVRFMPDIDPDKLDAFFEATEDWNSAMAMSNSMAFISQFGEYNPGGGKDEVLKYLNEAEIQVKLAEKALAKVIDCVESKASE